MQRGLIVDVLVGGILLFALVRGWRNGTMREGFGLLGLCLGLLVSAALSWTVALLVAETTSLDVTLARLIGLLCVVALVEVAVIFVLRRKSRDVELGGPRWLDRAGGVVVAVFRGVIVAALALYSLLAISASERDLPGFTEGVVTSLSGDVLAEPSSPVAAVVDGMVARTEEMEALTLAVRSQMSFRQRAGNDRITFSPAHSDLVVMKDAELELFDLVNDERERVGLTPLEWCDECARVARGHSLDMYEEGYFSHVDTEGQDPFERLQDAGIGYAAAGENLAVAPSVRQAHGGLMASPDHRANILRAGFDEIGIGIFRGPYGLMCTQVFRRTL